MRKYIQMALKIYIIIQLSVAISCSTNKKAEEDIDLDSTSDISDENNSAADSNNDQQANNEDLLLDDETQPQQEELAIEEAPQGEQPPPVATEPAPVEAIPPAEVLEPELPPAAPVAPVAEAPPPPAQEIQKSTMIQSLNFKPNEVGGTVLIEADGPVNYTTRYNKGTQQFVIEIDNAVLPDKLKRSLNTKDIEGAFGAIDAYQNTGSRKARFVIQLREGMHEPAVQLEGKTLLVIASNQATPMAEIPSDEKQAVSQDKGLLTSFGLADFISNNTKYYGKKISLETDNLEVREALRFITEESGINMVISEEVSGKINLRLRQVPWDQALILVMKTKKLGYTRQGNVLRIAPLADLKQEEDEANKLMESKKTVEPLVVRVFPVNYAKADEMAAKLKDFLSTRGKILTEGRTNSIIVTDINENLENIGKLISSLDIQPPQVLIEGKIVEATENFTRDLGVRWNASGTPVTIGRSSRGPVYFNTGVSMQPSVAGAGGTFGATFNLGTLDVLGSLGASLSLNEREDKVKIIASPRILTLSNEKAVISQKSQEPYKTVSSQNGIQEISYSFKDINIKLEVTPQVTADSSILMDLNVLREFKGANIGGDKGDAFPVNSRESKTKVLVKNGQTAVIGGMYKSDSAESTEGVPGLKDLPLLGVLFRSNSRQSDKNELVIFLTPRIVSQMGGDSLGGESVVK